MYTAPLRTDFAQLCARFDFGGQTIEIRADLHDVPDQHWIAYTTKPDASTLDNPTLAAIRDLADTIMAAAYPQH